MTEQVHTPSPASPQHGAHAVPQVAQSRIELIGSGLARRESAPDGHRLLPLARVLFAVLALMLLATLMNVVFSGIYRRPAMADVFTLYLLLGAGGWAVAAIFGA